LNVLDEYSGDKRWLDPFFDSGNWYRAFHRTGNARKDDFFNDILESDPNFFCIAALANIHRHSFCTARVAAYGPGVYCSPNPTFVENGYVKISDNRNSTWTENLQSYATSSCKS